MSILDYFVVCQGFYSLINQMIIDEERKYVLKKYSKVKGLTKVIESDHNLMWLEVNVPWNVKVKQQRQEIFNLRNKDCQQNFHEFTNNSVMFTNSALIDDARQAGKVWLKNLRFAILKNFRKIRISNVKNKRSEIDILLESKNC